LTVVLFAVPVFAHDTVYYYYTTPLHNVAVETDASGNVIERTYYAPYGQVLNREMRDGPGYAGHEEDPAAGLVYMQQRYYDPTSGRFISTDPVLPAANGSNFNRYWYAKDNPYRYTDPDGRCAGGMCDRMVQSVGEAVPDSGSTTPSPVARVGLEVMLTASGLGDVAALAKGAATVGRALSDARAPIYGKAQVTRAGGQETTHASTSTRIAADQAARPDAQSVHLNQRISTVTNNGVKSSLRPDVATVRTDGKVDVHEVLSPRQEPNSTAAKYNNALGNRAGTIKCVPQDKC
jgi:RHS repeat-associated protein